MKNALQQIRELKTKLAEVEKQKTEAELRNRPAVQEPIALIGIGCRFPGGQDAPDICTPAKFWNFLCNKGNAVRETPADRWDSATLFDPDPTVPGKTHIRHGSFLAQVDGFDPPFFNLAPREAVTLDPQQRLLLETSWEALEDANIVPSTLMESATGVFIGMSGSDYATLLTQNSDAGRVADDLYGRTGVDSSVAAGRLSYTLGLTGPCIAVDTACSSSLVAVHQACQSLRRHECDLALAGGVALMLSPENTIAFSKAGMLATDGRCKTFDAAADGYVRGEGCGIVVLKRLADAQTAGDTILAIIRGSMINHDGPSSGLTVPRGPSQQAVIRQALKEAAIDPTAVSYIEAHGTGTALGDPIELGALRSLFHNRTTPLWVGSVKTNLGHLEAAAGIAGLIKAVLMLQHAQIPPHLHFQTPTPNFDWNTLPIQIPTTLMDWTLSSKEAERIAGVSSFGYSGTNAHVLLSAPPVRAAESTTPTGSERPQHLLTLAAKTAPALLDLVKAYQSALLHGPELRLADLCYTAHTSRSHFPQRLAIVTTDQADLVTKLRAVEENKEAVGIIRRTVIQTQPSVVFLFTGQGSQYREMGRELYVSSPTFRAALDRCEALYQACTGESLLAVLYPDATTDSVGRQTPATLADRRTYAANTLSPLDNTTYTQPALFALEYALATLWQSWRVQPNFLIGHSVGEVAAACVAGVFSLEDGIQLIAARGRLMGALPPDGAMVALATNEAHVAAAIAAYPNEVSIAAVNGPESVVISGMRERVLAIAEQLAADSIRSRPLTVSHAFHSPLMAPMLAAFREVAERITYHLPKLPLIANVTGTLAGAEIATPEYWVRHAREAVRFADGLATLHEQGEHLWLEIGPRPVLLGMVAAVATGHLPASGEQATEDKGTRKKDPPLLFLPSLREESSDWQQMLTSLGALYVQGASIDWARFDHDYQRRKVTLPTYPFQRQRHWIQPVATARRTVALTPLIDKMFQSPAIKEILFETAFSLETFPFLTDHRIDDTVVAPGACHLAMLLSAAALTFGPQMYHLTDVMFPQPLFLDDTETRTAQILFTPLADARTHKAARLISFAATADTTDDEVSLETHATGTVSILDKSQPVAETLAALQARATEALSLAPDPTSALQLGPIFQWLAQAWRPVAQPLDLKAAHVPTEHREVLVKLCRPEAVETMTGYLLHPGLLDGCFQAVGLLADPMSQPTTLMLPFALASFALYQPARGDTWWCHIEQVAAEKWNIQLFDQNGQRVADIQEFQLRTVPAGALQSTHLRTDWLYTLAWQATPWTATTERPYEPDSWLILGSGELADALVAQWQALTPTPIIFRASLDETAHDGDPVRRLVHRIAAQQLSVGVIFLGELPTDEKSASAPEQTLDVCSALLHLAQALVETTLAVRLWVVTNGCQSVNPMFTPITGGQHSQSTTTAVAGALWGMGRTLAQEQPQLHTRCIDLELDADVIQKVALLRQEFARDMLATSPETQIAYRAGQRYVARVQPWQAPKRIEPTQPMRLQLTAYGSLENLQWTPMRRRQPGPDEVEVAVKAAGLNFRDVLNALGMLQTYYRTALGITDAQEVGLGFECAGIVTAVGSGVRDLSLGDRVMGLGGADGTFASYSTAPAAQMTFIPSGMSDAEAATLPLAFLTAWYGLVELAQLKAGDRILIHAAAGGVGQAAVQIAQSVGAEIFATASPDKWDFLRRQGIVHLMNSRTLLFAAELHQLTCGRGVDVVLNSLKDPFIEQSLAGLGTGGRFVEIGKLGIWSREQMQQQRADVAYHPFDLGEVLTAEPALAPRLWQSITAAVQAGTLHPLPRIMFPAQESVAAFRYMQAARQTGKVVVTFGEATPVVLHKDATYLITGGLGALGLQIAQQLVADGAQHLVLAGRRGVTTAEQQQILAQLAAAGANVHVVAADLAQLGAVEQLLQQCRHIAPLRGIVHAAGLLNDGVLTGQTRERFATVMQPKVAGAWHLHTLTAQMPLDFFVCFSSDASLLGSPGQSNYAAANAFLDTLMQERQRVGQPGISINWSAWQEIGMAVGLQAQIHSQGMAMIAPKQGRLLFRHLLQQPVAQIGVLPLKRQQPTAALPATQKNMRQQLHDLPEKERRSALEAYLRSTITAILGLPATTPIDPQTRLFDFGFDSLMAVEMKNKLEAGLACRLRSTVLFDYPTLSALTPYLLADALGLAAASLHKVADDEPPAAPIEKIPADLDDVSDDELSDLLLAKLDRLGY
jgi:myxalamid-type polyketide synthase MxaB